MKNKFNVGDTVTITKNKWMDYDCDKYINTMGVILEADYGEYFIKMFDGDMMWWIEDEINLIGNNIIKTRGFQVVTGYTDVHLPTRSTSKSAGYDISLLSGVVIHPGQTRIVSTGLKAYMQDDEVLKVYIRSSVGIKRKIMLANVCGIIDADYFNNKDNEGHIMLALHNYGDTVESFNIGERVAQGIFEKYLKVDDDVAIWERKGGIGSSNAQ